MGGRSEAVVVEFASSWQVVKPRYGNGSGRGSTNGGGLQFGGPRGRPVGMVYGDGAATSHDNTVYCASCVVIGLVWQPRVRLGPRPRRFIRLGVWGQRCASCDAFSYTVVPLYLVSYMCEKCRETRRTLNLILSWIPHSQNQIILNLASCSGSRQSSLPTTAST